MSGPKSAYFGISERQYELLCRSVENEKLLEKEKKLHSRLKAEISELYAEFSGLLEKKLSEKDRESVEANLKKVAHALRSDISNVCKYEVQQAVDEREKLDKIKEVAIAEFERLKNVKEQIDAYSPVEKAVIDAPKSVEKADDCVVSRLDELKERILSPLLKKEILTALATYHNITDAVFSENFKALTIIPLIKECESFITLFEEYETLIKLLGEEQSVSFSGVEQLDAEVSALQCRLTQKREQEYISQSIDEVMEEMGYSLFGERTAVKKSGKSFRSELFSADDATAVNVTYSSDGQITMEIGGLDNRDRPPTNAEAQSLVTEMEGFCSDYEKLLIGLGKRGVYISKLISKLEPNIDYAQIINTSDYDINYTESNNQQKSNTNSNTCYMRNE